MRHDRPRIALLLGATLVTAACGGDPSAAARPERTGLTGGWSTAGCELHREPMTMTAGGRPMPITPPRLDAAMARIDSGGRAAYAHSYAGIEVDQEQVRAIVYRVPSAKFDKFIRNSAEDTCIEVLDAPHGLTELTAWHDRIVADLPMWAARGVRIFTVGARHDGTGVEIGTPDVELARHEFPTVYGQDVPVVVVERGPVSPLAPSTRPQGPRPGS
jgi:hypothetical protein